MEPLEHKAQRCAKYKALRMDLRTTDKEETEPRALTHVDKKYSQREAEESNQCLFFPEDTKMSTESYIITHNQKNLFASITTFSKQLAQISFRK